MNHELFSSYFRRLKIDPLHQDVSSRREHRVQTIEALFRTLPVVIEHQSSLTDKIQDVSSNSTLSKSASSKSVSSRTSTSSISDSDASKERVRKNSSAAEHRSAPSSFDKPQPNMSPRSSMASRPHPEEAGRNESAFCSSPGKSLRRSPKRKSVESAVSCSTDTSTQGNSDGDGSMLQAIKSNHEIHPVHQDSPINGELQYSSSNKMAAHQLSLFLPPFFLPNY